MFEKKAFFAFKQLASHAVGYENEDQHDRHKIKEKDCSTSVYYEKGLWKYHDNYFGGEPYGGREVIFYDNQPVHIIVYYGWVNKNEDADLIYGFLRKALQINTDPSYPRGPKKYKEGKFMYKNKQRGDIICFSGKEVIYQNKKQIYEAIYAGGLVDQLKL